MARIAIAVYDFAWHFDLWKEEKKMIGNTYAKGGKAIIAAM